MVVAPENHIKILSADCFFKAIEKMLCLPLARVSVLCGISARKLEYWEDGNFLKIPVGWTHFEPATCDCKNFHLSDVKFAFAVESHIKKMMPVNEAKSRVLGEANTLLAWNKYYEEAWQATFRSQYFLRFGEAVKGINQFSPNLITLYYLNEWVREGHIKKIVTRTRNEALEMIDIYQLYAVYVVAMACQTYSQTRSWNSTAAKYIDLANELARKQYDIDCNTEKNYLVDYSPVLIYPPAKGNLALEKIGPPVLEPTKPSITAAKNTLHDFLHAKFPDYLTIENIQFQTHMDEDELLDLIDEMSEKGLLEKRWSKPENAFAFRTALDKMNK
ncbi:MAG: hypothetical protein WCI57_02665 [Candidatus Berkelbacteria bacterium]